MNPVAKFFKSGSSPVTFLSPDLSSSLLPLNPNSGAYNWTESLFSQDGREVGEILGLVAGLVVREGSLTLSVIHSNEHLLNVQHVPGTE